MEKIHQFTEQELKGFNRYNEVLESLGSPNSEGNYSRNQAREFWTKVLREGGLESVQE